MSIGVRKSEVGRVPGAPRIAAAGVLLALLVTFLALALAWAPAAAIAPPSTTTTLRSQDPEELPELQLPFAAGSAFRVSQGNAGSYTHQARGFFEFAWDFQMGEGTMVVAARAGRVAAVEAGMSGGGLSDAYAGRANYVLIAHPDGLYSVYLHLATAGVLVHPGEWVTAGEGIALSGNTGFSSGPHLHFQAQETALPIVGQSLPVAFVGAGVPALGERSVSQNRYLPEGGAPLTETGLLGDPSGFPQVDPGVFLPADRAGSAPADVTLSPDTRLRLLTHQWLPVSVTWADPSGGSAAASGTPVRLMTLDAAGTMRVASTGTAPTPVAGVVGTSTPGWLAVWVEYFDGERWRTCADTDGRPVAAAHDVGSASVFVAEPGLSVRPIGEAGDETLEVAFRLENPGDRTVHLLDVTAESVGPAGAPVLLQGGRDFYLRPGESRDWAGTFAPETSGIYTFRPRAWDAAGKPVTLVPRRVGDPAWGRVVVEAPDDGSGGSGGGDPAGGGSGDPGPDAPGSTDATVTFADVPADHPAHAAVEALAARGVVGGYLEPGGRRVFRPDDPVARAQFAKMLVLTLGLPVPEGGLHPFQDVEASGPDSLYPDDYVAAALAAGLLRGVSVEPPRFQPYTEVTRRQVALVSERAGLEDPALAGDQWTAASRGEVAVALARLAVP